MVTINLQKKDVWYLSAIFLFLIGVGLVIALDSGNPRIMGHSSDEIEGIRFGEWQTMSFGQTYTAATDGFVVAQTSGLRNQLTGHTPVGTVRVIMDDHWGETPRTITMPVKKGDTWTVTREEENGAVYWIPLGN